MIFDIKKAKNYHLFRITLFMTFLIPVQFLLSMKETRWRKEYEELRQEALLYARSCGVEGDSKIIKRAYDYSVRFWMRWPVVLRWIQTESDFIPTAKSKANAKGLTQVLEETASYIGEVLLFSGSVGLTLEEEKRLNERKYNLYEIEDNLLLGFSYLKFLSIFSSNPEEALARYLAGKKWVDFLDSRYVQRISDGKPIIRDTTL
ncbi:MAG: transglycosylase SLT domain-containing protein [candidate division WOR-3 bacterium]